MRPSDPRAAYPKLRGGLLAVAAAVGAILALRPHPRAALAGGAVARDTGRNEPPRRPAHPDPNRLGHDGDTDGPAPGSHAERGPASKRVIAGYGFWIFLLSDIVMFAAFFAAYAVLVDETAGGPAGRDLFDLRITATETGCLLLSSFTCGLAVVGLKVGDVRWFHGAMGATFLLGAAFIGLELREFASMIADGNGPGRSAFLSAFFALVGLHGLHVFAGLLWLLTMMAQVWAKGGRADIARRVMCFSLFWHALDIVWVALFTVVYLMGVAP